MYWEGDFYKCLSQFHFIASMNEKNLLFSAIKSGQDSQVEKLLKANPQLVTSKDDRAFTPLIFAAYFDKEAIVKTLIKHHAPVDGTDALGNTALIGVSFKGNVTLASYLLKHGAAINAINHNGVTPLIFASMYNQTQMVELLLKHQADISIMDNTGKMAIDYAREKAFETIVTLLK